MARRAVQQIIAIYKKWALTGARAFCYAIIMQMRKLSFHVSIKAFIKYSTTLKSADTSIRIGAPLKPLSRQTTNFII
jgi:hypothetical protein